MLSIFSKIAITAFALTMGVGTPMNDYVRAAASSGTYISEVKVGMGKTSEEASKELLSEGYTILTEDGGGYADLNEKAGSKDVVLGKGQKIVYLGYKTTDKASRAITDLAVMNMRGGYSVKDYETLMANQLKTQIIPFVERFLVTIDEYRTNLNSEYPTNKARAEYMKSMLNKLSDDDTGGLMGDLLVNETKYELGDEAYNALSETEKKQHADILTIVMQANGKTTLSMESLLTKATDTEDTSWIDRLEDNSLDNLKDQLIDSGVDITELDATLDRKYGDDANKLLEKWDTFSHALQDYDEKANALANIKANEYDQEIEAMKKFDENKEMTQNGEAVTAGFDAQDSFAETSLDAELVAAHDNLVEIDYDFEDGSNLAEFFAQDAGAFNGDGVRDLYPIVASLSAGQLAGLDFLSLQDLVTIATADATSYPNNDLGDNEPVSIYEGVNREIFQKGKVALTNKALRAEAMSKEGVIDSPLSATTYVLMGATVVAAAGMIASFKIGSQIKEYVANAKKAIDLATKVHQKTLTTLTMDSFKMSKEFGGFNSDWVGIADARAADEIYKAKLIDIVGEKYAGRITGKADANTVLEKAAAAKSKLCTILGAAFTVAMAVLAGFSIYSTVTEMINYYHVKYSPIPKYIVEETSITEEVNGVKLVKRNDSAYYQVAETNRSTNDEFYEQLQNYADLNGDVGLEWLALYYVRQDGCAPIKADSLKVVKGSSSIPAGYTELGIHNFDNKLACNLTNKHYCYNDGVKGTYVYFQVDEEVVSRSNLAAGSNFSTGYGFLFAGIGAIVGAGIAAAISILVIKKKQKIATIEE